MQPLKVFCLSAWLTLFVCQLALAWPPLDIDPYWVALASLPLLIPLPGLLRDRLYTYRWVGFLMLIYFCLGVSEAVANPTLRWYGFLTILSSLALFLGAIYRARYLRQLEA